MEPFWISINEPDLRQGDLLHACWIPEFPPDFAVNADTALVIQAEQAEAPFYLRRVKEALVTFPHPETGEVHKLFTKSEVRTAAFDRRQKILDDPEAYRQEQIERKLPEDFEDLTEQERQRIIERLEDEVLSVDPAALREEIGRLTQLVEQAKQIETRDIQSKLIRLKAILREKGTFDNPKMKLLLFTEHKDTLDYLAGDGRDERPLGKLREWRLTLTQIHGGMKIGDRDTPGSRIYAEREFRESAQVLVATEAAGIVSAPFRPHPPAGFSGLESAGSIGAWSSRLPRFIWNTNGFNNGPSAQRDDDFAADSGTGSVVR